MKNCKCEQKGQTIQCFDNYEHGIRVKYEGDKDLTIEVTSIEQCISEMIDKLLDAPDEFYQEQNINPEDKWKEAQILTNIFTKAYQHAIPDLVRLVEFKEKMLNTDFCDEIEPFVKLVKLQIAKYV